MTAAGFPSHPPIKKRPVEKSASKNRARKTPAEADEPDENAGEEASEPKAAWAFWKFAPSWLVITIAHAALCLILAWLTFPAKERVPEPVLDLIETEAVDVTENFAEIEVDDLKPAEDDSSDADAMSLLEVSAGPPSGEISLADLGLGAKEILAGGDGTDAPAKGEGDGPKVDAKFFGTRAKGNRFVFVVDNSNSMNNGRFETALVELVKAVKTLGPRQKFYVVFYSDMAYPLFYPQTVRTLVPATSANIRKLEYWLTTVPMCLQTRGEAAMRGALALKPDVLFLIGDGRFTDKTSEILLANPVPGVVIHTLGMQLAKGDAAEFAAIAKSHNGTYRDVGITPQGRAMLQKMGQRPRHTSPSGVWGLALGKKKKKK